MQHLGTWRLNPVFFIFPAVLNMEKLKFDETIWWWFDDLVSFSPQIEGTKKLLNKDLGELINKMRLAQQNSVTSLKEECQRQMLAASHTLALDSKNLLDAVDQARVRANLAKPRRNSQDAESSGEWGAHKFTGDEMSVGNIIIIVRGYICYSSQHVA